MTRRRPVVARLAAVVGAGLVGSALIGSAPARAASKDVALAASAGYASAVRAGTWVPVSVSIRSGGSDLRGELDVVTGSAGNGGFQGNGPPCYGPYCGPQAAPPQTLYRLPVDVAAGATKGYAVDVLASAAGVHVELRRGGDLLASADPPLAVATGAVAPVVAVVSDSASTLDGLGAVRIGDGQVQLVHLTPAELPASAIRLRGFDAVVIDDASTGSLSAAQRSALLDDVAGGGSLLLAGGSQWQSSVSGLPQQLVPVTGTQLITVPGLTEVSAVLGSAPLAAPTSMVAAEPRQGGRVLIREAGHPLLVSLAHGEGRVLFVAVDPAADPIRSWSGAPALLHQLAVRSLPARAMLGATTSGPFPAAAADTVLDRGSELAQALTDIAALQLPGAAGLVLLLLLYAAVVGPGNYLVLRRLRRRDLTWVTVPAISLLAAVAVFATGLGIRAQGAVLSQVRIVTLGAQSGDHAYVEVYAGLYAPHAGSYELTATSPRPHVAAIGGLDQGNGRLAVVAGTPAQLRLEDAGTSSVHGLASADYVSAPPGGVTTSLGVVSGHLRGSVANHLGTALRDVQIVGAGAPVGLNDLADGGVAAVDVDLGAAPPGNYGALMPQSLPPGFGPGVPAEARDQLRRTQVVGDLEAQYAAGVGADRAPVLIGVATRPVLPPSFEGAGLTVDAVDAVVVPLHAGAASAELVDLHLSATSPFGGAQLDPEGQAVYQAALPIGTHAAVRVRLAPPTAFGCAGKGCTGVIGIPVPAVPAPFGTPVPTPGVAGSAASNPPTPTGLVLELFDAISHSWRAAGLHSSSAGGDEVVIDRPAQYLSADGVLLLRIRNTSGGQQQLGAVSISVEPQ